MQDFLKINENDKVVVALKTIPAGETVTVDVQGEKRQITALEEIPAGHKMAICDIPAGAEVIKYGYRIGNAKEDIRTGAWVHTHNLKTALGDLLEYQYEPVEEVIAFPHPYGCSQMGDDQEHTRQILADLINHPNAGGVLVLGLGCENSNIDVLKNYIGDYDENRVRFLVAQECGDEIAEAVEVVKELINDFKNYFKSHNQTIYENPSPGNKKGGISTLEDKSLGCTQKSGSAKVKGVLRYGETVKTAGLNLLSAPGNDLVAATALAAAGAQIVLFTTGRGTPFAYVVEVASGRKVCSEKAGFHDMAIFKQGVTL